MKRFLILLFVGLFAFGYFSAIYSEEKTPAQKWSDAEIALEEANDLMDGLDEDLAKYKAEYTEKANNALWAFVTMFNPIDAIKTLFLGRGTPNRVWELKELMISIYVQQEILNEELTNLASARDTAYEEYEKTTSQPADKINHPEYANIPNISLPCLNRCGHIYHSENVGLGNLSDRAIQGHGVYCTSDPHKEYWYYSCPAHGYPGCPAPDQHHVACVGGCGQIGAAEWGVVRDKGNILAISNKDQWGVRDELVTISSHKKQCQKRIKSSTFFVSTDPCPYYYYQCSSGNTCPNASNHVSGSSVAYHACGVHLTSISGDHSYGTYTCGIHSGYKCKESHDHKTSISFCTSTDSNGNSCTNTGGYWECQPHSHSYPTLVACAHSNCTEMVSSRTLHRAECGSLQHYYWPGCPNNTNWWSQASSHALKSCRRNGCTNTWRRCLTPTPTCPISGTKCWAQ